MILGPDGAGKSSVIEGLMKNLSRDGRVVKIRHLKPRLLPLRRGEPVTIVTDPHGKPPRSALLSAAKILFWLMEEWTEHLFHEKKGTLLLCDRYYHDLLIDPLRYRYGGPAWMARLVGGWMPRPDLWILLDAPVEVLQARKREVPFEESARQRQAYLTFIGRQRRHVIVDASRPLDQVIAGAEWAVASLGARTRSEERP
ncbi:MAG: dTMP kinase [Terracidiphilus sp.]